MIKNEDNKYEQIDGNCRRTILSYNAELMTVKIIFDEITVDVKLHSHPHVQSTYVLKGSFRFFIEEKEYLMKAGDSILFESNIPHGCVALEKNSQLLDTFTPMRQDFL